MKFEAWCKQTMFPLNLTRSHHGPYSIVTIGSLWVAYQQALIDRPLIAPAGQAYITWLEDWVRSIDAAETEVPH